MLPVTQTHHDQVHDDFPSRCKGDLRSAMSRLGQDGAAPAQAEALTGSKNEILRSFQSL
jgi:hypothetical protein